MRKILSAILLTTLGLLVLTTAIEARETIESRETKETKQSQVSQKPKPITLKATDHSGDMGNIYVTWHGYPFIEDTKFHIYYLNTQENGVNYKEYTNPQYVIKNGEHKIVGENDHNAFLPTYPGIYSVVVVVERNGQTSVPSNLVITNTTPYGMTPYGM